MRRIAMTMTRSFATIEAGRRRSNKSASVTSTEVTLECRTEAGYER
jgi:hypothetical protein